MGEKEHSRSTDPSRRTFLAAGAAAVAGTALLEPPPSVTRIPSDTFHALGGLSFHFSSSKAGVLKSSVKTGRPAPRHDGTIQADSRHVRINIRLVCTLLPVCLRAQPHEAKLIRPVGESDQINLPMPLYVCIRVDDVGPKIVAVGGKGPARRQI